MTIEWKKLKGTAGMYSLTINNIEEKDAKEIWRRVTDPSYVPKRNLMVAVKNFFTYNFNRRFNSRKSRFDL